ncbi:hypothetical protein MASR2M70_03680 [Bacillota bacterium]
MQKIYKGIDKLEEWLLVSGFTAVVIIVFMQVILRYVFNNSLPWVEELARYMFVYLTWIGADRAVRDDKHIKLTILQSKLKSKSKYLEIFITLICAATFIYLTYYGIELIGRLMQNVQISPTLRLPMWYFYLAVPLGAFLMSIRYVHKLLRVDIALLRKAGE